MKNIYKIAVLFGCILSFGFAGTSVMAADDLQIYTKSTGDGVQLKWLPAEYSSQNNYKVYRNDTLIGTTAPLTYEKLQAAGFDADYIFMVHPFRDVKTIDDQILAHNAEKRTAAFRILRAIRDNQFAQNIGQYFVDAEAPAEQVSVYKVELLKNSKVVAAQTMAVSNQDVSGKNQVFSLQATSSAVGVSLNWGSGNTYAFYNLYRKKAGEKEFTLLSRNPIYRAAPTKKAVVIPYEDNSLKKGEKTSYFLKKIDMFGEEGEQSIVVTGERLVNKKPPLVKNLFVKNRTDKVILRWQKAENVMGYNVYRSLRYKGGYQKINKKIISLEAFFDSTINGGHNYYYYVTSVNKHGESYASAKMLAYVRDVVPPAFPQNLTFQVKAGEAQLTWEKVASPDLLGYRVYMSMDKDAEAWSLVTKNAISATIYVHQRPETLSRHDYYYRVVAVDTAFNESAPSNVVVVKLPDVTAPKQPIIKYYSAYPNKIELQWSIVSVYDFSHYNVYRKQGDKFTLLNKNPIVTTKFVDSAPLAGENEYVVTSIDKSDNESVKKKIVTVIAEDIQPVTITAFSVQRSKAGANISFATAAPDYSGFEVFRSSGIDPTFYNISSMQTGSKYTDKNISKKLTYFYMVKVYDSAGNVRESKVFKLAAGRD